MPSMIGYIKLNRKLLDWRWYKDANTARVFLHLLLSANVEDHGFQRITVRRGQIATSYDAIANALDVSVQNVRTAINHLKSTGELTVKKYPKFQVFTIVSWDLYQCNQQAANRQKQAFANKNECDCSDNLRNFNTVTNSQETAGNSSVSNGLDEHDNLGLTGNLTGNQQAINRQLTGNQQATNNNIRSKEVKNNTLLSELSQRSSTDKPKPKKVFEKDGYPYKAARWLADAIEERMPTCKPYTEDTLQSWAADFDKCNRIDGHPWKEMSNVLAFSQEDSFWQQNILSGSKFRKQYITLLARMNGGKA